jgi:hypothetical protein
VLKATLATLARLSSGPRWVDTGSASRAHYERLAFLGYATIRYEPGFTVYIITEKGRQCLAENRLI